MSSPVAYEAIFNESYDKFYSRAFHIMICPKKLITLAVIAMEVVEPTNLDGSVQKSLVLKMVQKFINTSTISEQSKKYYLKLVENGMLSACIEVVIAASKGKVAVNNLVVVKKPGCLF
jgi:hypothetical protein